MSRRIGMLYKCEGYECFTGITAFVEMSDPSGCNGTLEMTVKLLDERLIPRGWKRRDGKWLCPWCELRDDEVKP